MTSVCSDVSRSSVSDTLSIDSPMSSYAECNKKNTLTFCVPVMPMTTSILSFVYDKLLSYYISYTHFVKTSDR